MVGDLGIVHAVDIQAPLVARAQARATGAGVNHLVHFHQCGVYDLPLADDSVDLALLVSTLGEIPDKPAALSELRRVLKPGGRLGITTELLFPSYLLGRSARHWVEDAGFRFLAKTGSPVCYHMVFSNDK
jgi:ubiquinone/menaquinone biosynthesis C-methylase UbiE